MALKQVGLGVETDPFVIDLRPAITGGGAPLPVGQAALGAAPEVSRPRRLFLDCSSRITHGTARRNKCREENLFPAVCECGRQSAKAAIACFARAKCWVVTTFATAPYDRSVSSVTECLHGGAASAVRSYPTSTGAIDDVRPDHNKSIAALGTLRRRKHGPLGAPFHAS